MKRLIDIIVKERMKLNKNRVTSGVLVGSMIGLSVGMLAAGRMKNIPKKKIMKTARRAKSTLVNGITSLWG